MRHPDGAVLDAELRLLGRVDTPDGVSLSSLAEKYGIAPQHLSSHRLRHLGLPPLLRGRPSTSPVAREQSGAGRPPTPAKAKYTLPAQTQEGQFAQLVKTVATLVALGSWRGLPTVRALAARHRVGEEEVLRAHRRASLSVRDARGGLREQLELSVGVLTQIRDQERQVAEDYGGVAQRIVAPYLPNPQTGAPPASTAPESVLDRARAARAIASQAQDCAIAAQRQIDQNTIHRRTAPLVQVSFSASPDFTQAHEALVLLLCAVVGDGRAEEVRRQVARGLQVLEDAGGSLNAPEFIEYLAELGRDASALVVGAENAAE